MPPATTPPARSASPPAQVRFVAPDVGGGFGAKNFVYPEHVLMPVGGAAGRPSGQMDRDAAARSSSPTIRRATSIAEAVAGARRRGPVSRACASTASPMSAPISPAAPAAVQTFQYAFLPGTVYRIPAIALRVAAVFTNTAPIGVMRGPGYAEADNIIERLIDEAARRMRLRPRRIAPPAIWCRRRRCR